MYTVLLTDDEPLILETLCSTIHWEQFGVDTLLTASDGAQALELMARQKVDLLVTDIKMPHMDGFSLLKNVRKQYPHTRCILLTAYGEFEYARQAIQLGIENYLLKPLNQAEFENSIETALDNIYIEQHISKLNFYYNVLLRWVKGIISDTELSERANLLQINLYFSEYCTVLLFPKQSAPPLHSFCLSCVQRLEKASYEVHYFKDDRNRYVFIIGGAKINQTQLYSYFAEEARSAELLEHIILSAGDIVKSAGDISESYHSAGNLLDGADLNSCNTLFLNNPVSSNTLENKLLKSLLSLFYQKEMNLYTNQLSQLTDDLLQFSHIYSPAQVWCYLTRSLFRLFSQEFPTRPDIHWQLNNRIQAISSFSEEENFTEAVTRLLDYSHLLFLYFVNQLSPIIQAAVSYIQKSYQLNISIQEFCHKRKISPSYLGYLFKTETGIFFNNYLMQYRICCSIPLLLESDQSIHDIASSTGFTSTSYFITCFKKQTGMTPVEYRQQHA